MFQLEKSSNEPLQSWTIQQKHLSHKNLDLWSSKWPLILVLSKMCCSFVLEFPDFKLHIFLLQPSHPNTTTVAVDQSEARVVILGCEGCGKKM